MATDPLSTTFLVGNGFSDSGLSNVDLLIQAYRRTRQPALDALTTKQTTLEQRQSFMNTLRSKLEALQSAADTFLQSGAATKFQARSVTVSDTSVLSATAADGAALGSATIKVERLATSDVLQSAQRTLASSAGLTAGAKSFTISGRNYTVTLDGTETYETLIGKIVSAINSDSDAKVTASLVKDSATTGRLSLTAKTTGADGAITFSDAGGVLAALGLTGSIKQTTGTTTLSVQSAAVTNTDTILFDSSGYKRFRVNGVDMFVYIPSSVSSFDSRASETASTLLSKIASAINGATGAGATAAVQIAGVNQSRLVISNSSPGGQLVIEDVDGVLSKIGIASQTLRDERTKASATGAGYALGTTSDLNASLTVNGVTISRSSNTISDAISGVTLTLLKAQQSGEAPVSLTTGVGTDKVADTIKPLLDAYNDALRYIKDNIKTIGGDAALRTFQSDLRSLSSKVFSGTLTSLADIGIKVASDGTLSVDNKDRLKQQLETDPAAVAALFTASGGFADSLMSKITGLVGSDGLLQARSNSLGQQIKRVSDQKKALQDRIDREVEQQRREYTKLQELFYSLQGQMSQYSAYVRG
ncbi:MAG: flagellar filament capping protein FliD [Chlorobi bacterium]|nr:flagellar filament capping protein FliD [Chlorobiota bacterium]